MVIDLRTVDEENVVHSGRKLIGTQAGVMIEIEKLATSVDLYCYVFVVADGKVGIINQKLKTLEYKENRRGKKVKNKKPQTFLGLGVFLF